MPLMLTTAITIYKFVNEINSYNDEKLNEKIYKQ